MSTPNLYRLILRYKGSLLLKADNKLPETYIDSTSDDTFVYTIAQRRFIARDATSDEAAEYSPHPLRDSYNIIEEADYLGAQKGFELLYWNDHSRYCGVCGSPLHRSGEISKICPKCGIEIFPHVSPAVIVLIRKGSEALLVHARSFKRPFFGLVAGFVETGESLEECVEREIKEETSLSVTNIRYFGSQAWGYPSNIMIGFTADYAGGELRFEDNELAEGGFFSQDNLPLLPGRPSIARRMIDAWLDSQP